ncbi:oxidoreductase [Gordonia alkanivorans]|uniref:Putative oxidoreductase n=1 Tax=Gordonia alkanivorans NBRC 16433 TaxID=1027371 RepID=F9W250_9ACTN|nr:oxidoreductase [Gordonia alkanivorans]GAA14910.1 putative oxidoreductase [Gordonia alkanivorans NBRC 16433]
MAEAPLANPSFGIDDIPGQTGRTFLITGANNGLGLRAAVALARAGGRIILACRTASTGRAALQRVREAGPDADHRLVPLDLGDLSSVRTAGERVVDLTDRLDVAINNAGIMAVPFGTTAQGFELHFGVNHLGHFMLTDTVMPALLRAEAPRVVTLSSIAHRQGSIDVADLGFEHRPYRRMTAYAQSKLANILFGAELARRSDASESPLRSVIAHPGVSATNLFDPMVPRIPGARAATRLALRAVGNSEARGSLSQIYAATMPDVQNNDYLGPTGLNGIRGPVRRSPRSHTAEDTALAQRLWEVSARLTGADFHSLTP